MASDEFTKTVSPSGGYSLVYTVLKSGFVSLKVLAPNALLVQVTNATSFDTALVLSDTVSDLNSLISRNNAEIRNIQSSISEQQAILSNPSSTSQQKAAAQVAINNYNNSIGNLQNENSQYNNIITYVQSRGPSDFFELVLAAKNSVQPSPNPPTPTITQTTGNVAPSTSTNTLPAAASDDSGTPPTATANTESTQNSTESTNAPAQPGTEREDSEEATVGDPPYENEKFLNVKMSDKERPGRRIKNPLGYFSSYTYQLSLYMVSPSAYEAFIAGGRKNINLFNEQVITAAAPENNQSTKQNGVFLVAQSGGIGKDDIRAPGFEYDYYIDGLSFVHMTNAKETNGPLNNIDFKFQIVEPYGFSFISNLRRARNLMPSGTGTGNTPNSTGDPLRQFFILGIRFYGYDQSGRQVLGNELFEGEPLDPAASGSGALFETFYDILINDVKFKIDGSATVYNITAAATGPNAAVNVRKGMINSNKEASGSTVRDLLLGPKGLLTQLNQEQQDLVKSNTVRYPITYKIEWLGDAEEIALASVVSETRTDKSTQASSKADNTTQVNDQTETKSSPNKTATRMSFSNKPIIQAIDQIIARSKYLEDAMVYNYTDAKQYDPKTNAPNTEKTPNKKLKWFNISPKITNIKWDPDLNDWVYDITYVIQTYLVPHVDNPIVSNKTNYYGPHKKYEYWYTGNNTEIISFEQVLNTAYHNNVVSGNPNLVKEQSPNVSSTNGKDAGAATGSITAPNITSTGDKDGSGGTLSMEAVNSVRTTLYDPASYINAKVQILGDPDYLMQESNYPSEGLNQAYSRYHKDGGFTINPTGGQVFFEIDFKEAVDYSTSGVESVNNGSGVRGQGGTLSINDSILFWLYGDEIRDKIDGVAYMLLKVTSSFKGGSFTQTLETANPFTAGQVSKEAQASIDAEIEASRTPTSTATDGTGQPGSTSDTGLKTDQPVVSDSPTNTPTAEKTVTAATQPTES